ncbi:hypothetical protein B0J11DRAFT_582173 [Dendryphion nanum]|uniref:Rhodopsin domain-containing protein n=1 Tax=Dendryphion nanum TaxID=256645 RepID=A0A9P9IHD8_9PLEO|nr:hypothetical protein B0J11DRAFT_582173 [Dendryphion nanum]
MELPLSLPPPGVSSNFENPQFLGLPVLVTASLCLALLVPFAVARIYARVVVLRIWKFEDYVFCLTCALGIAMIAFSISIVLEGPNGHHAWDVSRDDVTKASLLNILSYWIALGPIFWFLKLALFCFLLNSFTSVRWFKNCVLIGIVITGLVFSTYTIVITLSCGPRSETQTMDYLLALKDAKCTGPNGINAMVANITTTFNAFSNVYLLLLPFPLISTLELHRLQRRGVYIMHGMGLLLCTCSIIGAVFRIKSWHTSDLTGSQIPHTVAIVLEIALSLIITCMPSVYTLWRYYTLPDIDDITTLATPNSKNLSTMTSLHTESRATWRKTHLSIEEMPYRQASVKYKNRPTGDTRMKALPATPLPLNLSSMPPSPRTPNSFHSMHLPIMLSPRTRRDESLRL